MKKDTRHVGFDVDTEKIAVAVAEPAGEVRSLGEIPNREESVRRLVQKLGPASIRVINRRASPSTAVFSVPRNRPEEGDKNGRAHWT